MSDIKAAMDKLAHETQIEIEAPSKRSMTRDEVEAAKKSHADDEKQKKIDHMRKMKEAKQLIRDEKIKAGKSVSYKSRTASIHTKLEELDDMKGQLARIIEKLDKKEEESGLRAPVKVKQETPVERPEPKLKHPEVEEAEKNLEQKNPLTPDKNNPINIENKTPMSIEMERRKQFEGYNKKVFTSLHHVPSIKPKKI